MVASVSWNWHWRRLLRLVLVCLALYGFFFTERVVSSPLETADVVDSPSSPLQQPLTAPKNDGFSSLMEQDRMSETPQKLSVIVQEPTSKHTATVIFLHGFGDSGAGWAPIGEQFAPYLPHVKFIFPSAPPLAISAYDGMLTPAWYDIDVRSISDKKQDEKGLLLSRQRVMQIVKEEIEQNKIPASRILIGGFSQGCVLGLLTTLTADYKFAGIVGLSGYMPLHEKIMDIATDANKKTPIFWGHGTFDPMVKYEYGEQTVEFLEKNQYKVQFHSYPHMGHSVNNQELQDLLAFLKENLPAETPVLAKV